MAQPKRKYGSLCLLIRGCTNPPKSINVSKRKGTKNGNYLAGMSVDMTNMEKYITNGTYTFLHNTVSNMVSLKCCVVLQNIKNTAMYAKKNNYSGVKIYYTGHGQEDTGNWCFSDGVVTLKEIINVIKQYWGDSNFSILCDCCYSGNWVKNLKEYKNELKNVFIMAACLPNNVAYDHPQNGGYFTQWLCNKNSFSYKFADKQYKYWCSASISSKKHLMSRYCGDHCYSGYYAK